MDIPREDGRDKTKSRNAKQDLEIPTKSMHELGLRSYTRERESDWGTHTHAQTISLRTNLRAYAEASVFIECACGGQNAV